MRRPACVLACAVVLLAAEDADRYATQVAPLLAASCVECHGPRKAKAKLRLDSAGAILLGGSTGPAVVAGHPERSLLLERVLLPDGDEERMPPEGPRLSEAQVAILREWIAAGAEANTVAADAAATPPPAPTTDLDALGARLTPVDPASWAPLTAIGARVIPLDAHGALVDVDASPAARRWGDAQLALLAPLAERIIWLDLGGTAITDAGLAALPPMPRLQKLVLARTAITGAGLAHLGKLGELRSLNCYESKVDDAGLQHLAPLSRLERLFVWQTQVTAAGEKELERQLPQLAIERGE